MKTVIEMAREAGAELAELPMMDAIVFSVDDLKWNSAALERLVELARADEREACETACDSVYHQHIGPQFGEVRYGIAACKAAIRARRNT